MIDVADVTIRPMDDADAEAVAELTTQLGYNRTAEQIRRWLAARGNGAQQAAFVAQLNERVVGWIEVSLEWRLQSDISGHIGGLVILDGLRGAGLGKRLCECAESWARERGAAKVRVTSRSTRPGAHRFYLRDGYQQTKISMVFEKTLDQ